jgi:hypothetical protein
MLFALESPPILSRLADFATSVTAVSRSQILQFDVGSRHQDFLSMVALIVLKPWSIIAATVSRSSSGSRSAVHTKRQRFGCSLKT